MRDHAHRTAEPENDIQENEVYNLGRSLQRNVMEHENNGKAPDKRALEQQWAATSFGVTRMIGEIADHRIGNTIPNDSQQRDRTGDDRIDSRDIDQEINKKAVKNVVSNTFANDTNAVAQCQFSIYTLLLHEKLSFYCL